MRPAKSSHRSRKENFPEYILKFDVKYNGKNIGQHSGNIFLISTCVVSRLADARYLCVATMLETVGRLLSRLYCLKFNASML